MYMYLVCIDLIVSNHILASIASASSNVVKSRQKRTASTDASVYSTMTHNIPHRYKPLVLYCSSISVLIFRMYCVLDGLSQVDYIKLILALLVVDLLNIQKSFPNVPVSETKLHVHCTIYVVCILCACTVFYIGCSVACHLACTESMPNTCGLPQSLALQLTTMSPPKKTKHDTSFSSTDTATGPLCSKENLMAKIPKRLSIDLMRCQVSSSTPNPAVCSPPITVNQALSLPSGMVARNDASNTTELSITSSMLEGSGDSMDEDDLV